MNKIILVITILMSLIISGCSSQEFIESEQERVLITNLESPWGMAFVNEEMGEILITQRRGQLKLFNIETQELKEILGTPQVVSSGQGGLLDVDYDNGFVYLAYSSSSSESQGVATHVGRGELNLEEFRIENFEVLRTIEPFQRGGSHFGSRVLVVDEYIFVTTGDRGSKDFSEIHPSQNTSNEIGTILRLYKNGSIPPYNPYVNAGGFIDSIYTYGHRNVQGIVNFNGEIFVSEHGEQDGDMIHKLVEGGNYGWPLVHYGCTYAIGREIGGFAHERDDIGNPLHHWECGSGGFPPAGMDVFNDKLYVGNLRGQYVGEFEFLRDNESTIIGLEEVGKYVKGERIRDIMKFEGGIYVITDSGKLVQINLS
ncbi:MAG: PQQ-dependent sugar dehydrogenase [Nanoarchaeota archaeon]|nr:PQQ-dependent sugar dehydrogenase [Nanoarchaeota archaeon]